MVEGEMSDRIRLLMDNQHLNQQSFAEFLGMSSATLSNIINKKQKPTLNTVEAITKKFTKLSLDWLMYGQGPMFKDQQADAASESDALQSEGQLPFDGSHAALPSWETDAPAALAAGQMVQAQPKMQIKYVDKPQRKITEIRIFYDDQTWESFVPKK